jgi:gluconokinase
MSDSIVIMGVAGCGKSSCGSAVAAATGLLLMEGDDFHSASNRHKMSSGTALTDADRDGWLASLAEELRRHTHGLVLTCSALKRSYRDRLRQACPALRFVFLDISPEQARTRVLARAAEHFFSTTLVDSQFATLESPVGEPGVLRVDATAAPEQLCQQIVAWLAADPTKPAPQKVSA